MNLNKVFLLGRLTADPQLKTTVNGNQVATFSIATNRIWNDKISGRREETEFHNIVVWGQQADVASRFLRKGNLVLIEGRLQTRSWEDQRGQKRRTTEIVSERLQLPPRSFSPPSVVRSSIPTAAADAAPAGKTDANVPTIEINEVKEEEKEEDKTENEIKKEDLPF